MVSLLLKKFIKDDYDAKKTRSIYGYVCGIMGIILNLILFAAKFAIGVISASISITADAFNNLTDAGSSVISLFGFVLSGQKADDEHPFGHGRIEYLAGIFISAAIILVGFELLGSSWDKIVHPTEFVFNKFVVIVLVISIAVKLYMAYYNNRCGKEIHSSSLCAVAKDSISDVISTTAILLSSIFMYFTDIYIDGYVGLLISILIIRAGVLAVMETASPLLGGTPDAEFVKRVEEIVRQSPATVGIHDLVVHDYGPSKVFVSLHMEVDGRGEMFSLHDAVDLVEQQISKELGCEAVIHMDPIDLENPLIRTLHEVLTAECMKYSEKCNVHDLRIVPGPTHTNIIFDVILPPEQYPKKDEVCERLCTVLSEMDESYFAVIKPEMSYCG